MLWDESKMIRVPFAFIQARLSGEHRFPLSVAVAFASLACSAAAFAEPTSVSTKALTAGMFAEPTPIPIRASTGYRDYCDGMKTARKRRLCPQGHVSERFWRPLAFPTVDRDAPCPVSTPHRVSSQLPPLLGSGPVYVGTYSTERTTIEMPYPAPQGSVASDTGWTVSKFPLVMPKSLREPLLIRGRTIDRTEALGFSGSAGRRPFEAMQFPARPRVIDVGVGTLKSLGLTIWAAAPGCYAVQIDGRAFSRVIVFRIEFRRATRTILRAVPRRRVQHAARPAIHLQGPVGAPSAQE